MKKDTIGGQAVIEGVMLRNKTQYAVAVRKPDGSTYARRWRLKRPKYSDWFFIRGILGLADTLVLGIKTLTWSANQQDEEESESSMFWPILAAFVFAMLLFVLLPYALTHLLGVREDKNPIWFNLVDGAIKLIILLLYIYLISRMKDVQRLFQYHGAEHKTVHLYEHGMALTSKNAKEFNTFHARCGTNFLMITVLVGVMIFSLIPSVLLALWPNIANWPWIGKRALFFSARILVLPIIAGISYEILKVSDKNRYLALPGMWLQRMTTREPTKKQLEVAFKAMQKLRG